RRNPATVFPSLFVCTFTFLTPAPLFVQPHHPFRHAARLFHSLALHAHLVHHFAATFYVFHRIDPHARAYPRSRRHGRGQSHAIQTVVHTHSHSAHLDSLLRQMAQ